MSRTALKAIIIIFGVGFVVTLILIASLIRQQQDDARREVRESYCTAEYPRYSDQWKNCVDDRR